MSACMREAWLPINYKIIALFQDLYQVYEMYEVDSYEQPHS